MPAKFRKMGIAFQYPENWTLDEDDALAGRKSVTVYSPGGAFWTVSVYPHSTDPQELAHEAVKVMKQEYPEVEVEAASEMIAGRQTLGFDLSFYYLDLTNTASVRCFRTGRATYAFFCQAEDREFAQIQKVFLAMATSFLGNLTHPRDRG
jgi:hypothetical protein